MKQLLDFRQLLDLQETGMVGVIAAHAPAEELISAKQNVYIRQQVGLYDLVGSGAHNKEFSHIAGDMKDSIPLGHYVEFHMGMLVPSAVAQGDGKASIVLQLRIPNDAPRIKAPEKITPSRSGAKASS